MAMPAIQTWTIGELDRLPDDGNRYELLDGELLVTPPPTEPHERVADWLHMVLGPFVNANGLGWVQRPRAVIKRGGSQLEPDLMVRADAPFRGWENAPLPILVVEVSSRSTRGRDLGNKREYYVQQGVAEYWVVDREAEIVIQVKGQSEHRVSDKLLWSPPNTSASLEIDVAGMFTNIRERMTP